MTQRIEPFISWIWRTEFNPLFSNLSRIELFLKELNSLFSDYTQSIELFILTTAQRIEHFLNMTQRIVFFKKKNDSKNFLKKKKTQRIELFFSKENMTQRTRIFFYNCFFFWSSFEYDSFLKNKNWLSELNLFLSNVTLKIELFFWTLLEELNPSHCDSKNWTFFFLLIWLWELNTFFNTTQKNWLKKFDWEFCFF